MQYVPYVEIITPEYRYWNPLTKEVCATYAQAEKVIADYLDHKRNGTGGFRAGAPGQTKISAR